MTNFPGKSKSILHQNMNRQYLFCSVQNGKLNTKKKLKYRNLKPDAYLGRSYKILAGDVYLVKICKTPANDVNFAGFNIRVRIVHETCKIVIIINCFHQSLSSFTITCTNTITYLTVGEHYCADGQFSSVSFSLSGWKCFKMKKRGRIVFQGTTKPSSKNKILVLERPCVVILKLIQQSDYVLITQNIII